MSIIYFVGGFVGLILVLVGARGVCVMRSRAKEEEEEEAI